MHRIYPTCPFCQYEFATVEQLTQHLIYDRCEANPDEQQAIRGLPVRISSPDVASSASENDSGVVPVSHSNH